MTGWGVSRQDSLENTLAPTLGVVPKIVEKGVDPAHVCLDQANTHHAFAYHALCDNLQRHFGHEHIILLSSLRPREGKSTVALNLAVVMAQRDNRVIIIDAHFARPVLHNMISCANDTDLSSLRPGDTLGLPTGLQVIPNSALGALCPKGCGCEPLDALLTRLGPQADVILLDGPALDCEENVHFVAQLPAAILLVVQACERLNQPAAVKQAHNLLQRPILGTVLNQFDLTCDGNRSYLDYHLGIF